MMTSLFSMFDPTAVTHIQINWMNMMLSIMIMPILMWKSLSRNNFLLNLVVTNLNKEFESLFNKNLLMKGSTLLMLSLFLFILTNNITSNFPYTFCCSAHLCFSFALALPIWLSIVLFLWMNMNKSMFAHLVPTGTPNLLMPFMVLIELTSNFIRPMALSVRLTANLIAGHLLMALLGTTLNFHSNLWVLILIIQMMFISFELMIGLIQSYVFSVLMTLYSSEMS
uniref:ATP synthase subunit a n=1 Tax=Pariaconus pele TaxID=1950172 RepID=A0A344A2M5_9HEMI|nr:ATP synthase F0 subunit 6 [Pariaconus pele]AWU49016.1 ATP synthase F0 subunit 6 [Pariaconus pele]